MDNSDMMRNAAARGGDFLRSELARRRATLSVHRTPAWKDGADALDSGEEGGSPDARHQCASPSVDAIDTAVAKMDLISGSGKDDEILSVTKLVKVLPELNRSIAEHAQAGKHCREGGGALTGPGRPKTAPNPKGRRIRPTIA